MNSFQNKFLNKKVLLIATLTTSEFGSENGGGVDSVCQAQIGALVENSNRFDYHIVAIQPFNKAENEGIEKRLSPNVTIVFFNKNGRIGGVKVPGFLYQAYCTYKVIKKNKPDLIHSHSLTVMLANTKRIPAVATIHGYKKIARKSNGFLNDVFYEDLLPKMADYFLTRYTTVSFYLEEVVKKFTCKNVTTVYNSIDQDFFIEDERKQPGEILRIVTCALLTRRKGIHHVIDALAELKNNDIKAELVVVGHLTDVDYYNEINDQIKSCDLVGNVVFKGPKNRADIINIYMSADVGLFLSSDETFGLVPLEMLATKLPLVCSSVGVLKDLKEEFESVGVEIVTPTNATLVADAIRRCTARDMSRAQSFVRDNFHIRKVISQYENIYRECLL